MGCIVPLENSHSYGDISITGEGMHIRRDGPALMAIKTWEFFSMPHLLWHRASIIHGHLKEPVIPTPIAERFAVELSRLGTVVAGIRTPNFAGPTF